MNRYQYPFPSNGSSLLSLLLIELQCFFFQAITVDSCEVPLMMELAKASPCLQEMGTLIFSSSPINSTR